MAVAGAINAQFGFKPEVTYGTGVVVDQFVEFNSESIKQDIERVESSGKRPLRRVLSSDDWVAGRAGVSGDTAFEFQNKGMGTLLKHALGDVTTSQPAAGTDPTVYEHLFKVGTLDGKSLTAQVGRAGSGGTVHPFTYAGMKVASWELSCDVDGILMLSLTWVGASETTATGLATATYGTSVVPLVWTGGAISIGGTATPIKSASLAGDNGLADDRFFMSATTPAQRREALESAVREYTGSLNAEFVDLTPYNRFVNGTVGALTMFYSGSIISTTYKFALEVTLPAVRFDGETPGVPDDGLLEQSLPFKVLDSGDAAGPVQLKYRTTDVSIV